MLLLGLYWGWCSQISECCGGGGDSIWGLVERGRQRQGPSPVQLEGSGMPGWWGDVGGEEGAGGSTWGQTPTQPTPSCWLQGGLAQSEDRRSSPGVEGGWTRGRGLGRQKEGLRLAALRSRRQPGVWDTGKHALGASMENSSCRTTHTSLLSPTGHQPGSQTPPRSAGGQGWPSCMLKALPTLLAPQLPPGMLRGGRAADKGRCSPPGQAGVVGSWGRMATICLCPELLLCTSTGQGTWTETGSQPPPH